MRNMFLFIVFVGIVAAALAHSRAKYESPEHEWHCDQVRRWHEAERAGIMTYDRPGWPDYDGRCR